MQGKLVIPQIQLQNLGSSCPLRGSNRCTYVRVLVSERKITLTRLCASCSKLVGRLRPSSVVVGRAVHWWEELWTASWWQDDAPRKKTEETGFAFELRTLEGGVPLNRAVSIYVAEANGVEKNWYEWMQTGTNEPSSILRFSLLKVSIYRDLNPSWNIASQ